VYPALLCVRDLQARRLCVLAGMRRLKLHGKTRHTALDYRGVLGIKRAYKTVNSHEEVQCGWSKEGMGWPRGRSLMYGFLASDLTLRGDSLRE